MKRLEAEAAKERNDSVWKELRLHKSQVDNFVRGINMIYETGLFDVSYAVAEGNSQRVFAAFGESAWSWGVSLLSTSAGLGRRRRWRRRWCIECCRLFKTGDEDLASGAGIKVTPRPTHRRDPVPHPAGGRPAQLQQEDGRGRKQLGKMGAVSPPTTPPWQSNSPNRLRERAQGA